MIGLFSGGERDWVIMAIVIKIKMVKIPVSISRLVSRLLEIQSLYQDFLEINPPYQDWNKEYESKNNFHNFTYFLTT